MYPRKIQRSIIRARIVHTFVANPCELHSTDSWPGRGFETDSMAVPLFLRAVVRSFDSPWIDFGTGEILYMLRFVAQYVGKTIDVARFIVSVASLAIPNIPTAEK
jgi:hypothetical protein